MRRLMKGVNDLATVNPELAKEWHPTKNGDLRPEDVSAWDERKVWWMLPYDVPEDYPVENLRGKHFDFEWESSISIRHRKRAICPYLSKPAKGVWQGFNDLATVNPELAAQWHPTKNGDLRPEGVLAGCAKRVWWYLSYDVPMNYPIQHLRGKHFDFEWKTSISSRYRYNLGCPFLNGKALWTGFNDLATKNPELAKEWHPTKNGSLTPYDVTENSRKRVWWLLPYDVPDDYPVEHLRGKHFDFEWETQVRNRSNGAGCPFLSGHAVWKGFNDLATVNPELAREWHPTRNGDLTADSVTCSSFKKVWWQVEHYNAVTGKHHIFEWEAVISERSKGCGCPYLANYKGELYVEQFLKQAGVEFETHKRFADLRGTRNGQLSYDFAIRDDSYGYVFIEYNGIQHYESIDYFGGDSKLKKQKQHDKLKRDYAKKHGYKLITIKYTYDTYESVAEYLDKMLVA